VSEGVLERLALTEAPVRATSGDGLGLSTVSAGINGFGSASETGGAALLGLGYDIPMSRSVSLTPYWNGYALSYSNGDANVGQIGLAITVH